MQLNQHINYSSLLRPARVPGTEDRDADRYHLELTPKELLTFK